MYRDQFLKIPRPTAIIICSNTDALSELCMGWAMCYMYWTSVVCECVGSRQSFTAPHAACRGELRGRPPGRTTRGPSQAPWYTTPINRLSPPCLAGWSRFGHLVAHLCHLERPGASRCGHLSRSVHGTSSPHRFAGAITAFACPTSPPISSDRCGRSSSAAVRSSGAAVALPSAFIAAAESSAAY